MNGVPKRPSSAIAAILQRAERSDGEEDDEKELLELARSLDEGVTSPVHFANGVRRPPMQSGLRKEPQNVQESVPEELDLPHNRRNRGNFCEAWQSSMSCLKERMSYLYNNETLSDILFVVGRGRVRIPAHKFVLAVGSPVFDAMFNGPLAMKEGEKTVEIPDVEQEAFSALLLVSFIHVSTY